MKVVSKFVGTAILSAAFLASCAVAQEAKPGSEVKAETKTTKEVAPVLNFTMKSLDGKDVPLSQYAGKVVLLANTASKCGLTPQYAGLQTLHKKYSEKGLTVLGFPANNFNGQEPGSNLEIGEFCQKNYGVEFPMFSKISVKGDDQAPLYKFLTNADTNPKFAGDITWNFEKFLVGRNGEIVARFSPKTKPDAPEVIQAIEAELAK